MPRKRYPGSLDRLLQPPPTLIGSDNYEAESLAYETKVASRLRLLMEHYEINPEAASSWRELAIKLAQEHVPGLQPWRSSIDTDRHVRVLFRMLYLTKVMRFSEKAASDVLEAVFPDLGEAEAIRSIYREQERRPSSAPLRRFLDELSAEVSPETFSLALEEGIGPDVDKLKQAKKPPRGRPAEK